MPCLMGWRSVSVRNEESRDSARFVAQDFLVSLPFPLIGNVLEEICTFSARIAMIVRKNPRDFINFLAKILRLNSHRL